MWVVWTAFDPWWLLMNSGCEGVTCGSHRLISTEITCFELSRL